jgi:5'-nucleotidase
MGNPIILDNTIPQDEDILEILEEYRPKLEVFAVEIGETVNNLNGTKVACRRNECNFGNLITDAMLYVREKDLKKEDKKLDVHIAIVQAGGIKNSIHRGKIRKIDILDAIPFNNTLVIANVTGQRILDALQHSATFYLAEEDGGFLQFSGIRMTYNMSKANGQRVVNVKIRCSECDDDIYEPIQMDKVYRVMFTKFLYTGGDEFVWTSNPNPLEEAEILSNWTDYLAVIEYIKDHTPVNIRNDHRQIVLL